MEISSQNLFILLENAINDGSREELLEFLCDSADEQYLDSVINKIGDSIKQILSTTLDSQSKITNILSIILGLAEIALFGPEKSEYLTRCLLSIAVDKSCSIYNLKHVLTMLKTFFTDEHIMVWSSNEESLFVPLKLLGVKLTGIGDYDCQFILLETLWQISDADRTFWADMWFSNHKTRAMFLSLNADQFVLDCRKFLNCVNRNEVMRRTFAFVATSVSLGSIPLRKPYGSDFWIDFNYDTESISFFYSSLDLENEKTWETIFVSADMVEGYCIQNKKSLKTKELCITLKFPCSELLALEETSIAGLESQLIRMTFWSFLDIHHHTEAIFKGNYSDSGSAVGTSRLRKVSDCAEVVSFSSQKVSDSKHLKQKRRASESIDLVRFTGQQERLPDSQNHKQRRASEPIELLCASYPEERVASSQHYKRRRASECTNLICSSYPQELRTELHKHKQKRVSESTTLVSTVDLKHDNDNNITTEIYTPVYYLKKRKYTHCKKVSEGFVDSEEFNQDVHHTNGYMDEEIIAKDSRKEENLMQNQKFSEGNESEKVHDAESCGHDNDGVDVKNNLSLLKGQNKESLEINSHNVLQKDNASEVYADEDNVQNNAVPHQHSPERHRKSPSFSLNIVEDHNLFSAQYNTFNKNDSGRSIDPSGFKAQVKGKDIKSYKVHDSLHKDGELESGEEVNSKVERSLDESSQLKLNRICDSHLLRVSDSLRKSSQISVDGCLQSTPKRSQNVQLLAVSNISKRKSSHVSVDVCLQSTPKKSQNAQLLAGSNTSERKSPQLSPIVDKTNHVQPNVSPEKTINDVPLAEENRDDFDIEVETEDYQTHTDMECDTNIEPKKHKNTIDKKKNKHYIAREENSVGTIEAEENDNTLISAPQRKHRRAAVKARKRNKLILEKGSETSVDGSQHTNHKSKRNLLSQETEECDIFELPSSKEEDMLPRKRKFFESDKTEDEMLRNNASKSVKKSKSTKTADGNFGKIDHDEYAFCTPPPLVKRKSHKHSIFVTDTETGSSEVSWFSKFKLFETPKQSYSNRKKINEAKHQKKLAKPIIRKTKKKLKTHQTSQRNKASDSESRSKSAFSELERFSLVIENNKYKSCPTNNLSGLFDALDSDRHLRQSSIEDDDFQQDYQLEELDVDNEKENSLELNEDSDFHVSETSALNTSLKKSEKIKYKNFASSTSVEVSNITIEPNTISKNLKNIKSTRGSGKIKNNAPYKDKKRLSSTTMLKHNLKENKNVENSLGNNLDSITLSENRYKKLKDNLCQESENNVSNSITESQSISNNTPNILPNFPIAVETLIGVSPFKRNKVITSGRWISPNKILENQSERPSLECKNVLTEDSLSPFNDEKQGKKMHLNHFLESLSSVSTNPQKLGVTEVIDGSTTRKKSKTKPSINKSAKKHSFQHSISSENIVKDSMTKQNQQSPENYNTDLMQKEYYVCSPSLQNNSLHDIEEEKHSEKDSNNDPIESPFQVPSSMFRKTPSKMSGEIHLPTKPSVLYILSDEVNTLTNKLFSTLQKCMSDFREKMVALRESITNTADSMISNESKFTEKDLQTLARNCRESRIHIQKHLKKLYSMGMDYFESEKRLERRLAKKHKKAVVKYSKSLKIAQSIAEKALEERFILKSRIFLKSFLKKMELV